MTSRVVLFGGHMTDAPDRVEPRFPSEQEVAVRSAISDTLARWGVGPGDIGLCGGARGGDILFTEACMATGARVCWLLPLPIEAFVSRSVHGAGDAWETRFRSLLSQVDVRVLGDDPASDPATSPFVRGTSWLVDTAAREAAPGAPLVLLVWDGQPGAGAGGTASLAAEAERRGWPAVSIDPLNPV